MKTLVHISADFPDPLVPAKTRAVENLLAETDGFRHCVYSLNRVNWLGEIAMLPFGTDRTSIAYGAPPYGLLLERYLLPVGDAIAAHIREKGLHPSLIHAHKFSVEGLVAARVADRLDIPFIASLWGDTDCKIVGAKRGMAQRYRRLARQALRLLPAAPWTEHHFRKAFGLDSRHFHLLPVMTAGDEEFRPVLTHPQRLVSIFALDAWKRKGLDILLEAMTELGRSRPDVVLDIYGRGSAKSLLEVTRLIQRSPAASRVRLLGPLSHENVQRKTNAYSAFVMAPRRETYGMVHVEALLAGVPILWSEGRGIDGLLDGHDVGFRVDPGSAQSVAEGIRFLLANERKLKENIADLQQARLMAPLTRSGIAASYGQLLTRLTDGESMALKPIARASLR